MRVYPYWATTRVASTSYILLLTFLTGCAIRKPVIPEYERQFNKYPRTLFLMGKGEAGLTEQEPRATAEARAMTDLAKQIKVRVKETMVTHLVEENDVIQSRAEMLAQTIVDSMELKGTYIAYSKADKERDVYRAICILRREDAAKWLSEDIDEVYKSVNNYFNLAKEEVSRLDIKSAFRHLSGALRSLIKGKAYEEEYSVIVAPMGELVSYKPKVIPKSEDDIRLFFDEISNSIKLEKISGNNQFGKRGEGLDEPLGARLSYKKTSLIGLPVEFNFEEGVGELDEKITTNAEGKALCEVRKLPYEDDEAININAVINLDELLTPPLTFRKEVKFKVLIGKSILSMDRVVSEIVNKLEAGIPNEQTISLEEFTYRDTDMGSVFSRYLYQKLVHWLSKSDKFKICSYRSIEPSCKLEGNYWDLKDYLEINAHIKDPSSAVLSSATVRMNTTTILAESLLLEPPKTEELEEKVSYLTQTQPADIGQPQGLPLLEVKVWTSRRVYEEGEQIDIFVESTLDCYITIFDYQSNGEVIQIFPNDYSISGFIKSNKIYEIPKDVETGGGFKFVTTAPFGVDVIKVYASEHPFAEEQSNQHYTGKAGPYKLYTSNYRGLDRAISVAPKGGFATASCVITTTEEASTRKVRIMEGSRWQKK